MKYYMDTTQGAIKSEDQWKSFAEEVGWDYEYIVRKKMLQEVCKTSKGLWVNPFFVNTVNKNL